MVSEMVTSSLQALDICLILWKGRNLYFHFIRSLSQKHHLSENMGCQAQLIQRSSILNNNEALVVQVAPDSVLPMPGPEFDPWLED